jgi:hypothetical protein
MYQSTAMKMKLPKGMSADDCDQPTRDNTHGFSIEHSPSEGFQKQGHHRE